MSDPRTLFEPEPQWADGPKWDALRSIFQRMRAASALRRTDYDGLEYAPGTTALQPSVMGEMSSAKPAALIRTLSARWTQ